MANHGVVVKVGLKPQILDPQGRAIMDSLKKLGLSEVIDVRQNKQFNLYFEIDITSQLLEKIDELAKSLLCNSVIEDYSIEVFNEF